MLSAGMISLSPIPVTRPQRLRARCALVRLNERVVARVAVLATLDKREGGKPSAPTCSAHSIALNRTIPPIERSKGRSV